MPKEFMKEYELVEGQWYISVPNDHCPERETEYNEKTREDEYKCFFDMRRRCNKEFCPLKAEEDK